MDVPYINWLAVVIATLSSMLVGAVWYARPVFGSWWMKAARVDPSGKSAVVPIVATLIVSFITALVLAGSAALAQAFYGGNFVANSVITAAILWAGLTAARFITHDAFEGRPWKLTLLNISHELVTMLVMGLVIGLFGIPA